ncbi:MAG: mycothiol synthase [Nocardioides sp.]|nr:mycothiol synthase [Nocardioides sp.]
MTSVLDRSSRVDGHDAVDEATHLRLRHQGLRDSSLWLVTDEDDAGEPHGFALRHREGLDLVVAPPARGRGVATALTTAALQAPGPLSAWSHGDHPAARRLASRHGLAAARSLWVMRRSMSSPLPALEVPAGVRVRGFDPDEPTDAEAVLRVNAAAFAHHPEQGALDAPGLAERMAEPWFDPAGLLLAVDDSGVLGFHWTKRHSPALGEVYVVGIAPQAQGRGLGRVLTLAGLHHLVEGGSADVLLYVESENAPARAVYERLGFTHAAADTHVQYRR